MIRRDTAIFILNNNQQLNPLDLNNLKAEWVKKNKKKPKNNNKEKLL